MESRLADLLPRLNERDRRLALAAEAKSLGRGGISAVHRATGASRTTIRQGIRELSESADPDSGRVRALGGGRKKAEVLDTELPAALDSLIEPGTRGDPMSPLRWTLKSTRRIADELTAMGHAVSHTKVAALLRSSGYSLQGTRKTLEGAQHPDRDAQFRYINSTAARFLAYRLSQQHRRALPEDSYRSFFDKGAISDTLASTLIARYKEKQAAGQWVPNLGQL